MRTRVSCRLFGLSVLSSKYANNGEIVCWDPQNNILKRISDALSNEFRMHSQNNILKSHCASITSNFESAPPTNLLVPKITCDYLATSQASFRSLQACAYCTFSNWISQKNILKLDQSKQHSQIGSVETTFSNYEVVKSRDGRKVQSLRMHPRLFWDVNSDQSLRAAYEVCFSESGMRAWQRHQTDFDVIPPAAGAQRSQSTTHFWWRVGMYDVVSYQLLRCHRYVLSNLKIIINIRAGAGAQNCSLIN